MYCTHCGKKNSDQRLFCGFCGSPLGAPERNDAADDLERSLYGPPAKQAAPRAADAAASVPKAASASGVRESALAAEEGLADVIADVPDPENVPAPRARPRPKTPAREAEAGADGDAVEDPLARPLLDKPVQLRVKRPPQLTRAQEPVRPRAATGTRRVNTIVPPRETGMDDIFMEDEDELADFVSEYFDDDYSYEEPLKQNFFLRHIRGVVALTLLLITVLIVGYWLLFGSGQRVLGQLYISDNPATYIALGDEADALGNYEVAGTYYLKALELAPEDRNCAVKAANAFIRAGNSGKAATALEYLIAAYPDEVSAYVTLKQLYPDAASRPQRLTQLIRQGYERTGEASLQE